MTTTQQRWRTRIVRSVGIMLVAGMSLSGCGGHSHSAAARPAHPVRSSAASTASTTPRPSPTAGLARSIPTSVDIPAIGAKSSLVQLGLNHDKTVAVPPVSQPLQAGWYKYGPTPGQVGPAVILGHIDGDHQEGIFWRLHELKRGDMVRVGRQDGKTLTFTVRKVEQKSKTAFPTSAVYGNTADPELRLITCGGAFDASTRNYLDNIIVFATLNT
jgi:sortase (surface protein transpeptidase)